MGFDEAHNLKGAEELDIVNLKSLMQNLLKGDVIAFLLENGGPHVRSVESVIEPTGFVSTWRSRHRQSLAGNSHPSKRPDPFDFVGNP